MVKLIKQDIVDAAKATFLLYITEKRTVTANYDPKNAVSNLNAILQDTMEEAVGFDIPITSYRVSYVEPQPDDSSQSAATLGHFKIRLPAPLLPYAQNHSPPIAESGPLAFAGDSFGNNYKLIFGEHIERAKKDYKPIDSDDPHWFHLITHGDCKLPERAIRNQLNAHLDNFGMSIRDHPEAFKILTSKDKEQGSGKFHVVYDINRETAKVVQDPTTGHPYFDVRGLQNVTLGPDPTDDATIWMHQKFMTIVLNGCSTCFKPKFICAGCTKEKKVKDKSRVPAAQATENAKRRMKEKAGGKAKFTF